MSTQGKRALTALALGMAGAALLVVARPAGRLPELSGLSAWLTETPAETAVLTLAWSLGWAAVAWLTAVAVLAAAAAVPGVTGGLARRLLGLVAPRAVRRALEVALGLSLAAGPLLGGVANAAAPPAAPHNAVLSVPSLDRPMTAIPSLDRPLRQPAAAAVPLLDRPTQPQRPVTVHRGDSLWLIASRGLGGHPSDAQIAAEWPRWYDANRDVIGANPNLIQPGQHLEPPHDAPTRS